MPVVINGTTGITNPDGTAAAPALTGTDTNTGIFFPAADTIAFAEGGAEAMRIDSAGNVGIGTSSPGTRLHVQGGAGQLMRVTDGTTGASIFSGSGLFGFNNQTGEDGMFGSTASHFLYFATNGAERMRLDSSGNLGLGVTPSASTIPQFEGGANLIIAGRGNVYVGNNVTFNSSFKYISTAAAAQYNISGAEHRFLIAPSGTAGNAISFTQAMTLDASGRLSLGTTAASTGFASINLSGGPIGANTGIQLNYNAGAFGGGAITTVNAAGGGLSFYTYTGNVGSESYSERARIDSSGNLLVGTTSTYLSEKFNATQSADQKAGLFFNTNASFTNNVLNLRASRNTTNSSYGFLQCSIDGVADKLYIHDSGNVVNTNNSYGQISDVKLKENIVDATPKLEKLNQVRVVNFNFIGDQQKQLGVVAQELEQVFPSMIDESHDKDAEGNDLGTITKSVKYSVFVPMLIKAIQEQQALITALTARITALESN